MPAVYSKINDADKRIIYDSYLRGDDYLETALLVGIKRTTAYNIVKRANENEWLWSLNPLEVGEETKSLMR